MANNRMYLGCSCGDRFFLGKYYPYHWEVGSWTDDFEKKLNRWLYAHRHAHKEDGMGGEKDGRAPWALITEMGEDKKDA